MAGVLALATVVAAVGAHAWVANDFVTGGGWFEPPNSTQPGDVNFGFNAGQRSPDNTVIKGHVNVIDHATQTHYEGVDVLTYSKGEDPQDVCRWFTGDAEVNNASGYRYTAYVCDYGEPGRNDRFAFGVYSGETLIYYADNHRSDCPVDMPQCGELDGGNIQLHLLNG